MSTDLEPEALAQDLRQWLTGLALPIQAFAVGGSRGVACSGSVVDGCSDLDMFVFCDRADLDGAQRATLDFLKIRLAAHTHHGPFLSDGYGIGYRLYRPGWGLVEVFFVVEELWTSAPLARKTRFVWARGDEWPDKIETIQRAPDDLDYMRRYFISHLVPVLLKCRKYRCREDAVALAWYLGRAIMMAQSFSEALRLGHRFEPENVMKGYGARHGALAEREMLARLADLTHSPISAYQPLIDEAMSLGAALDIDRSALDELTALLANQPKETNA